MAVSSVWKRDSCRRALFGYREPLALDGQHTTLTVGELGYRRPVALGEPGANEALRPSHSASEVFQRHVRITQACGINRFAGAD
jgi:hypothetical protein